MCGRYSLLTKPNELKERFKVKRIEGTLVPRYNAAPAQHLPIISNSNKQRIILGEWGIIPAWVKDTKSSKRLINARAETIVYKSSFKDLVKTQRCLIIADGFYEWAKLSKQKIKQPYYFQLKTKTPFAMAGLYQTKKNVEGEYLEFAVITVPANSLLAHIHDRMPAILEQADEQKWLDNTITTTEAINMLKSFPANKMTATPISTRINNTSIDDVNIIKPLKSLPTARPIT